MRIATRILAVVSALALLAAGVAVAVEIGWATLGRGPWIIPYDDWYATARTHHWNSSGPRSVFLLLTAVGVFLIAAGLVRPRPRSLALESGRARAGVARRSLEQALERAAIAQDGVVAAKATIRRHRAKIRATTRRTQGDLQPRVESAARSCLQQVGVDETVQLTVQIDRAPSRASRAA